MENCRRMWIKVIELETLDEYFEAGCVLVAIIFQHGVGAALCLPSVLGFRGPLGCALARHGALCEAGWELSDSIERVLAITVGDRKRRALNPTQYVVAMLMHHSLCLSMVLPMNLMYPDNPHYHELVFLLQGASVFATGAQFYGFTLDVATASGLRQMRACTALTSILSIWSRVFRYWPIAFHCVTVLRADGNSRVAAAAGAAFLVMGLFNLAIIADSVKKFAKFAGMRVAAEEAPTIPKTNSDGKAVGKISSDGICSAVPRLMSSASSTHWRAKALAFDQ